MCSNENNSVNSYNIVNTALQSKYGMFKNIIRFK